MVLDDAIRARPLVMEDLAISALSHRKFGDYVRIQADGLGFIDSENEGPLLAVGLRDFNVPVDIGRWVLLGVATERDIGIESVLKMWIEASLSCLAKEENRIRKHEFETIAKLYSTSTRGHLGIEDARKKLKKILDNKGYKPIRRGLFRSNRWYRKIEVD